MKLEQVKGKKIVMIVWNRDKQDDVRVYLGRILIVNSEYTFINEENGWHVSLDNEQLSRLEPVSEGLKEMLLNADYYFPMTISFLPKTGADDYEATGIK